jgi:hypothetical protein
VAAAAQQLWAQDTTALPSTRAVRVRIETDRATYGVHDTVTVRLTLTNGGQDSLRVVGVPPWRAVRLIVTSADGRSVASTLPTDFRHFMSGRSIRLDPGRPVTLGYGGQQWTAVRSFGYGPLVPGQYTLTAVPLVQGPDVQEDVETVRSNRVAITVAP